MNEWGEGGGEGVVCQAQYNPEGGRREKGGGGGGVGTNHDTTLRVKR